MMHAGIAVVAVAGGGGGGGVCVGSGCNPVDHSQRFIAFTDSHMRKDSQETRSVK